MIHRCGLISDTHGHLHPKVFEVFAGVDAILHAGDVGAGQILVELEAIAPTHAVGGNIDVPGTGLAPLKILSMPFGRLILTHSHSVDPPGRDPERLVRHFASHKPRVIVFGHSHRALAREYEGVWLANPGPAGKPRFREKASVALMTWDSQKDSFAFEFVSLKWKQAGETEGEPFWPFSPDGNPG